MTARNNAALERLACKPVPVRAEDFNSNAVIPFGCAVSHLESAMNDFVDFIGFIDSQLHRRDLARLETMLMPANFSSMVGEFMNAALPKYCSTLVKNKYHNGHQISFLPGCLLEMQFNIPIWELK